MISNNLPTLLEIFKQIYGLQKYNTWLEWSYDITISFNSFVS